MNQGNNKNNEFEFEIEDLSIDDGKIELEVKPDQTREMNNNSNFSVNDSNANSSIRDNEEFDNSVDSSMLSDEEVEDADNNDTNLSDMTDVDDTDENQQEDIPDKDVDDHDDEYNEEGKEDKSDGVNEEGKDDKPDGANEEGKDDKPDGANEEGKEDKSDGVNEEGKDDKPDGANEEGKEDKSDGANEEGKEDKSDGANEEGKDNKPDDSKKDTNKPGDDSNNPSNKDNKKNDVKKPSNDASDKKEPQKNGLDKKRQDLKDKWNNRPKNPKEFANKAKDGLKNGAKNKFNNSKLGRTINKGKNAIDKGKKAVKGAKKTGKAVAKAGKAAAKATAKAAQGLLNLFISTLPWSAIVVAIVLVITLIIVLVCVLIPGIGGDVNEEENYSQYSKTDQKTLEKLEDIFASYPNADGTLALSVVLYPYFDNLHSGNVTSSLIEDTDNSESEDTEELTEDEKNDKDVEQEDDTTEDDPYLYPLRKSKVRRRLKKVLKSLNDSNEVDFKNYLKNDYFSSDGGYTWGYDKDILTGYNGYKDLFKSAGSNANDELYNLIIEDIYDNKDLFINYVYKNAVCASTLLDAGQIETQDLLKGNVLVDLKKPGCSNMKSCSESYYENYLTLEEYVKGVVYEEISGNKDVNQIAAQMVAAKTFTLSRRKNSIKIDEATGAYVIPMLWSTADQDFCHVDKGCNAEDIKEHYGYERGNDKRLFHGANRGPASDEQKELYNEAWNLSKDVYVVNEDGSPAATAYYAGCSAGKCMDQEKLPNYSGIEFKSILSTFYSSYSISTVTGDVSNIQVRGEQVCTNASTNYSATRARIVSFGLDQVGKIPYYEGGVASVSGFDGNEFGIEIEADVNGRNKKGLGSVGFVNWVYWSVIEDNLTNSNSLDVIISQGFEVAQDKLLMGDIGYSDDKTVIGIYAGDNRWILEDSITGNVVAMPDDRITKFIRHNSFKSETYNFTIRDHAPTSSEWGGSKMFVKPSRPKLMGECPWYAKNRAAEIIDELYKNGSLTQKQYNKYNNRVQSTSGNGADFYPNGTADKGYSGSTNIADLKAGSFIGMSSQKSEAGRKFGHVAVVEYVSEDKIIITEGWRQKKPQTYCSNYSDFSCVVYRKLEFNSYDEFYKFYSDPNGYMLKGYLYFLED